MGYRAALLNFSKGEISPELEARFDLPAYQAALRKATNVVIRRTGGVSKRMGTRYVSTTLGDNSRLLPFQFSDTQAYALEFTQALMRPYALGGAVLETGLKITAITRETQAIVTAAYHGYAVGDQVFFKDVPGMVEINDRFGIEVIEVIDANNFRINLNTTFYSAFVATDEGQVNGGPPPAPPAPPAVPPPIVQPAPPPVGSGSGGGYDSGPGGVLVWKPRNGSVYQ